CLRGRPRFHGHRAARGRRDNPRRRHGHRQRPFCWRSGRRRRPGSASAGEQGVAKGRVERDGGGSFGDTAVSRGVSEPFIRRPVATTLLMAGLLMVGLAAFTQLPVSALPQVDYPTIVVSTYLPGGSADTMASAVTTPLERQFGQMPALTQMTSVSSFG